MEFPLKHGQCCTKNGLCYDGLRHCSKYRPILYLTRFERILESTD